VSDIENKEGAAPSAGVLITGPDGSIFKLSIDDLEKFRVPDESIEDEIIAAEKAGFIQPAEEQVDVPMETPDAIPQTVVNIFVGAGREQPTVSVEEGAHRAMTAAGSTMSKYAASSTMSKYAAGSTMSKYAAGSTMSKYAAGSTMSKYAAGSTMAPSQADDVAVPVAVFFGRWHGRG